MRLDQHRHPINRQERPFRPAYHHGIPDHADPPHLSQRRQHPPNFPAASIGYEKPSPVRRRSATSAMGILPWALRYAANRPCDYLTSVGCDMSQLYYQCRCDAERLLAGHAPIPRLCRSNHATVLFDYELANLPIVSERDGWMAIYRLCGLGAEAGLWGDSIFLPILDFVLKRAPVCRIAEPLLRSIVTPNYAQCSGGRKWNAAVGLAIAGVLVSELQVGR